MSKVDAMVLRSVLPSQEIRKLVTNKIINFETPLDSNQIQPSSIDLRLSSQAWRMRASFLPGKKASVKSWIDQLAMQQIDLSKGFVLEKGSVYLVKLQESLMLPEKIEAQANAKSSTGRLDLFTRLITDNGTEFDRVRGGYSGALYAEIAPNSFSVLARNGVKLNQLRFKISAPHLSDKIHTQKEIRRASDEYNQIANCPYKTFSINLKASKNDIVGYRAKPHTDLIDLEKINFYKVDDFWEKVFAKDNRIVLDPGAFYILSSQEHVSVPPEFAAEMAPYLSLIGEFRVHYAGFFDPGFGYAPDNSPNSKAVLEVRCHETPFVLEHGQTVGRLIYEGMLEKPDIIYGQELKSNYQGQGLKLSKHFSD